MSSSRFAVAVHLMALAAFAEEEAVAEAPLTSERMANSVCTNPVVVRRALGTLREARLVTSQPGPGGGWRLTRAPERITLLDIYRAGNPEPALALPSHPGSAGCPVGRGIQQRLDLIFQDAQTAMESKLAGITVADVVAAIRSCESHRPPTGIAVAPSSDR